MGTADELALDVLVNALSSVSKEQLGIRQLVVGGQNEDWPVPQARGAGRALVLGIPGSQLAPVCALVCLEPVRAGGELAGRRRGRAGRPGLPACLP